MRSLLDTRYVAILAVALAGCGDDPPPADEPPLPGGPVTFLHQDVPVTELVFPATIEHGHASALFVIRNDTAATLAAIATTFEGDPGFAIDETMSTCVAGPELVPHDLCTVLVRWTAAATGAAAQLVVTSGGVTSSLSIRGTVGGSADLIADTSAIDFGIVPLGSSTSADVRLTNTTATAIQLYPDLPDGFSFGQNDCQLSHGPYPSVPANGSCNVRVGFTATTAGWVEGTGVFALAGAPVTLAAYGVRPILVAKRGAGTGRITSVPSGIDCGTDCGSQSAYVIGDATLYEQPDDGSMFAGWQLECGTDPTCAVPERSNGPVGVTFEGPGSAAITLTITGSAAGKLFIGDSPPPFGAFRQLTECARSCTTYVPVGAQLEIYAATPSRFDGWTGDCGGGNEHCVFQTITGDTAATATFDKEDRELVTLLPDVPGAGPVAFAPDGDLVIGSAYAVTKLGLDGTVRWSTSVPTSGRVVDLAVTTSGDIYTYSVDEFTHNATLNRWSMMAAHISTNGVRPPSCLIGTFTEELAPRLMASPNGDLGLFTGGVVNGQATNLLRVLKPDGAVRFSVDLGPGCAIGVAVGPDGVYQVLTGDQLDPVATSFHVVRYDASGSVLPGSGPYTMTGARPSVAIDSAGALAFHIQGPDTGSPGSHTVGRILLDGTVAFAATSPGDDGSRRHVAYDPAGNVIAAISLVGGVGGGGLHLEQRSPTGSLLWALDKSPDGTSQNPPGLGYVDVAVTGTGQVVVVGGYSPVTDLPRTWIGIYQLP